MGKRATCIWAYITWVGFIIASCQSCKEECKFHLNQALVFHIAYSIMSILTIIAFVLAIIPYVGWALGGIFEGLVTAPITSVITVFYVIAFVGACRGLEKKAPLLGKINLINK